MNSEPHRLGSFRAWAYVRAFQALFCLVLFSLFFPLIPGHHLELLDLVFVLLIVAAFYPAHALAYGTFDESGVTYRKYFRTHTAPWRQILDVSADLKSGREVFLCIANLSLSSKAKRVMFKLSDASDAEARTVLDTLRESWKNGVVREPTGIEMA